MEEPVVVGLDGEHHRRHAPHHVRREDQREDGAATVHIYILFIIHLYLYVYIQSIIYMYMYMYHARIRREDQCEDGAAAGAHAFYN